MTFSNQSIPVGIKPDLAGMSFDAAKVSEQLPCRDPFILLYDDHYYLYESGGERGIFCRVSPDLENWTEPICVFAPPADFHGVKDLFWAPECHYYKGNFYIFTSVFSNITSHRSVSVYRSESPLGPFADIANGCVAPRDWDTIDGTLYIDPKGDPWMIFVHEWTSMPDHVGSMVAARMADDLTHLISEPIHLFYAKDPLWATNGVTDGPYPFTTRDGKLHMLWSNFAKAHGGYVVALAHSRGGIEGPWTQEETPFYYKEARPEFVFDGGHGILLYTREGRLMLSCHGPNRPTDTVREHVMLLELRETDSGIELL